MGVFETIGIVDDDQWKDGVDLKTLLLEDEA